MLEEVLHESVFYMKRKSKSFQCYMECVYGCNLIQLYCLDFVLSVKVVKSIGVICLTMGHTCHKVLFSLQKRTALTKYLKKLRHYRIP